MRNWWETHEKWMRNGCEDDLLQLVLKHMRTDTHCLLTQYKKLIELDTNWAIGRISALLYSTLLYCSQFHSVPFICFKPAYSHLFVIGFSSGISPDSHLLIIYFSSFFHMFLILVRMLIPSVLLYSNLLHSIPFCSVLFRDPCMSCHVMCAPRSSRRVHVTHYYAQ